MTPFARFRTLVTLVAAPLLLACGDDGMSPTLRQAAMAESRWRAQGLSHYTVEARVSCFCPPVLLEWHELTVAGDSVIAARRLTQQGIAPPEETAPAAWFRSVEQTFADVRGWPGSMRNNRLEASFDPATGLPTRVNFITGPEIADGGSVREFRALKPGLTGANVNRR
jgi:hypothetical protein